MGKSKGSLVGSLVEGRYLIEEELGVGGIGAVYLARDLKVLGRNVVVKVLLEESFQNEYVVKKFRQEAEALSRLDHPNIVNIYDYGEMQGGQPYLVLQFIDGVSLRKVIEPGGTELERAANIVRQAANALTAAHEKGILHRDLKPDNVMLQPFGGEERAIVIDFGIAQVQDSVIMLKTVVASAAGTILYMPPEQLRAGDLTPASDTYALGVIAYEIITGQKPFTPQTPFELLEMQRAGPVPPGELRADLPQVAQREILRALSFAPEERHQSTRDFGNELYRSITGATAPLTGRLVMPQMSGSVTTAAVGDTGSTMAEVQPAGDGGPERTAASGQQAPAVVAPLPSHQESWSAAPKILFGVAAALLLLFMAAVVAVGLFMWGRKDAAQRQSVEKQSVNTSSVLPTTTLTPAAATPEPARISLEFSLTVQMMRNGKPYKASFESTGRNIYDDGTEFWINISTQDSGYLYLINEGPTASGTITYRLLYPNPEDGDARLAGGQRMVIPDERHPAYIFQEGTGTEKVWIIWSKQSIPVMEELKGHVNSMSNDITDPAQIESVRKFLSEHQTSKKTEAVEDETNMRVMVSSSDDVLVYLTKLEHR